MARKKNKKSRLPKSAEMAQRGGAAMANATKGRSRTFQNRKKEADRKACRVKVDHE